MPQPRILDFGPDPTSEAIGKAVSGFSSEFFNRAQQRDENDAVERLTKKYKPEQTRADYLRETANERVPIEKRSQVFDFMRQDMEEEQKKKEKSEAKTLRGKAAQSVSMKYGIPLDYATELMESNPQALAGIVKEVYKGQPLSPESQKIASDFMSDPEVKKLSDVDFIVAAKDKNIPDKEIGSLLKVRQEQRKIDILDREQNSKEWERVKPYIEKVNHNAELAKNRMAAGKIYEEGYKTGKVGANNFRNFISKYLPESIQTFVENPENRFARTASYQYLIGTKQDFGVRLSDADLKIVMDKIVSTEDTDLAGKMKIKFFNAYDKLALGKQEVLDEIMSEDRPPRNMDAEIRKRMQEKGYTEEFENAARNIMTLNKKGKPSSVWIQNTNGDKKQISREGLKNLPEGWEAI